MENKTTISAREFFDLFDILKHVSEFHDKTISAASKHEDFKFEDYKNLCTNLIKISKNTYTLIEEYIPEALIKDSSIKIQINSVKNIYKSIDILVERLGLDSNINVRGSSSASDSSIESVDFFEIQHLFLSLTGSIEFLILAAAKLIQD